MKLAVYDDHPVVSNAIKSCILSYFPDAIVNTFTSFDVFEQFITSNPVDIVIVDLITPDEIGVNIIPKIQRISGYIKIIIFSKISSEFIIEECYDLGIFDFIKKSCDSNLIIDSINRAIQSPNLKNSIAQQPKVLPNLTPKEKEICGFIGAGKSAKEIAELTQTSVNTINNQKNYLLEKYHCKNSSELLVYLTQRGLLEII